MTIKQTLSTVRASYPTISIQWNTVTAEYRIAYKLAICVSRDAQEASAAYETDSESAIGTARYMHEAYGK